MTIVSRAATNAAAGDYVGILYRVLGWVTPS